MLVFWNVDHIQAMTRPVPLGFFINKFPLWDGAGLWPIKVSQACPTDLKFLVEVRSIWCHWICISIEEYWVTCAPDPLAVGDLPLGPLFMTSIWYSFSFASTLASDFRFYPHSTANVFCKFHVVIILAMLCWCDFKQPNWKSVNWFILLIFIWLNLLLNVIELMNNGCIVYNGKCHMIDPGCVC